MNVVIPPLALDGPALTIRRFRRHGFTPDDLTLGHWQVAVSVAGAVVMARQGVPLIDIQRQLGHSNLGITSVYRQGIDGGEIIETVHARRAAMNPSAPRCGSDPPGAALLIARCSTRCPQISDCRFWFVGVSTTEPSQTGPVRDARRRGSSAWPAS